MKKYVKLFEEMSSSSGVLTFNTPQEVMDYYRDVVMAPGSSYPVKRENSRPLSGWEPFFHYMEQDGLYVAASDRRFTDPPSPFAVDIRITVTPFFEDEDILRGGYDLTMKNDDGRVIEISDMNGGYVPPGSCVLSPGTPLPDPDPDDLDLPCLSQEFIGETFTRASFMEKMFTLTEKYFFKSLSALAVEMTKNSLITDIEEFKRVFGPDASWFMSSEEALAKRLKASSIRRKLF